MSRGSRACARVSAPRNESSTRSIHGRERPASIGSKSGCRASARRILCAEARPSAPWPHRDPCGGAMSNQFEHSWQHERERLAAVEGEIDSCSIACLTAIGVGPGWRCLEVGARAGSIARWLSERVAPLGRLVRIEGPQSPKYPGPGFGCYRPGSLPQPVGPLPGQRAIASGVSRSRQHARRGETRRASTAATGDEIAGTISCP